MQFVEQSSRIPLEGLNGSMLYGVCPYESLSTNSGRPNGDSSTNAWVLTAKVRSIAFVQRAVVFLLRMPGIRKMVGFRLESR